MALPALSADLGMRASVAQWVPSAYVLTYGGVLLLGGRLTDVLGRRRVFVAGLGLFGATSLLAGVASAPALLICARALQGVGAALTVPAAIAIIAASFAEGPARNRALGVFGACASIGFSVGLVLGGVLTDLLSWRWVFLVKVPFVLAVAVLALRVVDEGRPAGGARRLELPAAMLSLAGLLALVLAITQLGEPTLPAGAIVSAAVLAVLCLAGYVVLERRARDPLVPPRLLRLRAVRGIDLASFTVLAAPFGLAYIATRYMQESLGHSALATGLALLPGAALSVVVSRSVAPWVMERFGLRAGAAGALVVVSLGFLPLLGMAEGAPYALVLLPASLLTLGLGMGTAYPLFTIGSVSGVEEVDQGVAAGVQNTALQVGGGLGLAIVATVVGSGAGDGLVDALELGALAGAALALLGAVLVWVLLGDEKRAAEA